MNIKGILKGALFSYIIAAVFVLGVAAASYFNIIDQRLASVIVFGGVVISVFLGALGAAKAAQRKRLFNALAISVIFIITVIALAAVSNGSFVIHMRTAALIGSIFAAGIVAALFA